MGGVLSGGDRTRRVASLLDLQHACGVSKQAIITRGVKNPDEQHVTGETAFQPALPIEPCSLKRSRKRIGGLRAARR